MNNRANAEKYRKLNCRYCKTPLPEPFLDLGFSPLANSLVPKSEADREEFECPLCLTKCPKCHLVQLGHVVPPDLLFSHYLYVSSTTQTFRHHFADYAKAVREKLAGQENPLAVDIGSNDGLLLSCYEKEGMCAVGVDPAKNLCEDATKRGLKTINRYFDETCVDLIVQKYGPADVVSGNNVFAHIDDIGKVCENVARLLDKNGMFVIEFPYLPFMLRDLTFDMIYHEHLSFIAITPLAFMLDQFGLSIFDIQEVASHGGSLRVFSQKKESGRHDVRPVVAQYLEKEKKDGLLTLAPYQEFAKKVLAVKVKLNDFIEKAKKQGKTIAGYGAPAKATTIVNFCELTPSQIDFIVDDNPLKQNHLVPGAKIPIVSSAYLQSHPTDYVIIFAWNFAKEITTKNFQLVNKGVQFLVPLPEPKLVSTGDKKVSLSV